MHDQSGPVRLAEVAEKAGVSVATASRVLNGSQRMVGEPFRSRVLEAAATLKYTANLNAQAVVRGASNIVGLIVHDIADPYFSTIAAGVSELAAERGTAVLLATTGLDPHAEINYVEMLGAQRARAVILVGSRFAGREEQVSLSEQISRFTGHGGRAACVSQDLLGIDTVIPQNYSGAYKLAEAMLELGHRRFVVLAGPEDLLTARDRLNGFTAALEGQPDACVRVMNGAFNRDGGYEAADQLARTGFTETCVFAVNDVMAVGAIAAFRSNGLSVPDDVSVAGFDDIAPLRDLLPPLTTVRLPLKYIGTAAAELALDGTPSDPQRIVKVEGDVVLRESTRPLSS